MSVYNGVAFLKEAVDSILGQTFTDFEFLIIDDCSTDNSLQILKTYSDPRIRILQNDRNIGLTKSLNRGIQEARGRFIARMDADDVSYPHRFEKQLKAMRSGFLCVDISRPYLAPIQLIFENVFIHSSAFFEKGPAYNPDVYYAQDLELWLRAFYGKVVITKDVVELRKHGESISAQSRLKQSESAFRSVYRFLISKGIRASEVEWEVLNRIVSGERAGSMHFVHHYYAFVERLIKAGFCADAASRSFIRSLSRQIFRSNVPFFWKFKMKLKMFFITSKIQ